jgi:hypothetical protein
LTIKKDEENKQQQGCRKCVNNQGCHVSHVLTWTSTQGIFRPQRVQQSISQHIRLINLKWSTTVSGFEFTVFPTVMGGRERYICRASFIQNAEHRTFYINNKFRISFFNQKRSTLQTLASSDMLQNSMCTDHKVPNILIVTGGLRDIPSVKSWMR